MADVADDDMTLPLKGLKVLDMTRVLAGVRFAFPVELKDRLTLFLALLYADIRRLRVCRQLKLPHYIHSHSRYSVQKS